MLKNYLKIALRNLRKNKTYSFINIAGLAIGIAGSLLILVYVANQLSYESMHKNRDNIVRVNVKFGSMTLAGAMPALGPAAADQIPEVKAAVRFRVDRSAKIKAGDKEFVERNFFFADSNVFKVFTFPLISGNKETALNNPESIVISQSLATKYFGNANPIGKTILYDDKYNFVVSAVMKNVPENTMLTCELIAPFDRAVEIQKLNIGWTSFGDTYTYLLLRNGSSLDGLSKDLNQLLIKSVNQTFASMLQFKILKLKDVYFMSDAMGELTPTGNITSVYLFLSISFLVLLIACLNYVNLSTARSIRRSKEVGLRKVMGAHRGRLIGQFFGESLMITLISVALSLLIFEIANPVLNNYFDVKLNINPLGTLDFYIILCGVILFVGLLAGVYPAIILSKYNPINSLKAANAPGSSSAALRKLLVAAQFAITIFLIACTAAIYKQINFMKNSDLGFNKDNVIIVDYPITKKEMQDNYQVIKQAFQSIPGVSDVSGAYTLPGINNKDEESFRLKGAPENDYKILQAIGVDYNFIPVLGLKIMEGRNFSKEFATDKEDAIILNETAVKKLGLKNPIGTEVFIPVGKGKEQEAKIIGVIKDFHVASFHQIIEPMFIYINPEYYYNIALRINPEYSASIISSLKKKWNEILPAAPFNYSFLSQTYDGIYESDAKEVTLFSIFSFLSIFIACLGLSGLVSYAVEVRTKEIGIRKVLGADLKSITVLLSKDFIKWTLLANVIALPLAYYAISKWLDDFAYKISIGISIFIISAVIVVMIALITVSIQAVKAAAANPVKSLRYE